MSRAWIAFYMGDYQKDTNRLTTLEHGAYFLLLQECWTHGKIPLDEGERAALAKMPLRDWRKIAPKINSFFSEDGTQKRATKEIEKAEVIRTKRALAGIKGGTNSGISRAIKKGREIKYETQSKQSFKQSGSQKTIPAETNHNNIEERTSTADVERGPSSGLKPISQVFLSQEALDKVKGLA